MALNRATLVLALALALACTRQAEACTPILSVGFGGVMAGWLVWLILAPFAGSISSSRLFWAIVVPVGMVTFAVPMFAPFLLAAALLAIAFPMHLALEFFDALFHPQTASRALRLFWNGLPLAVMLGLGLSAKAWLYGEHGGLRSLLWNYTHEAEAVFFAIWMVVGAAVLAKHRAEHRSSWPF